jgi:Protein of unknown function (DUF4238)
VVHPVTARHHFLPRVYLRGWCVNGTLVRYRMAGSPPVLHEERVAPAAIAFEDDLYRLPAGGVANGLVDDQLEKFLARTIEVRFPRMLAHLRGAGAGLVEDVAVAEAIRRFLRVTHARHPTTLRGIAESVAEAQGKHAALGARLRARAVTAGAQDDLRQLFDSRRGAVSARAAIAALVNGLVVDEWLTGSVQAVHAAGVGDVLGATGLTSFMTTDRPLLEWAAGSGPFAASFVLAPDLMVAILQGSEAADHAEIRELTVRHHAACLTGGKAFYAIVRERLPSDSTLRQLLRQGLAAWRPRQR